MNTLRSPWTRIVLVLALSFGTSRSSAQDVPTAKPVEGTKKENDERAKWVPLFERHASEYVVSVGTGNGAVSKATRLAEPVLRWWQPVRGGDDGALYLWLRAGRPVAVITFFTFKWPDGKRAIVHERHSLTPEPVEAQWRDRKVWQTLRPGLTYQPVPDAPAPAPTAPARLRQMQAVVRDFAARTVDDKDKDWPLRLLPKPLYRFDGARDDSLDGALFALAQGTDPEAFLIVDVRGSGENRRWEHAIARFTDRRVIVQYKGQEVYSGQNTVGGADQIYHSEVVIQKVSDAPEDFD